MSVTGGGIPMYFIPEDEPTDADRKREAEAHARGYREGLERAAEIADDHARTWSPNSARAARNIALAIRAEAATPSPKGSE